MPEILNGPRINERLAELDLQPEEFAARNEISEGYFRNLRNGRDRCSRQTAHRIARGLALPIGEVVLATAADGRRPAAEKKETETKEEPTHPKRRQDNEQTTGPKRPDDALAEAS